MRLVRLSELSDAERELAIVEAYTVDDDRFPIPEGWAIAPGPWPIHPNGKPAFQCKTATGRVFADLIQLRPFYLENRPLPQVYQDPVPYGRREPRGEYEEAVDRLSNPSPAPTLPAWLVAPPPEPAPPSTPKITRIYTQAFYDAVARLAQDALDRGEAVPSWVSLARDAGAAIGWNPETVEKREENAAKRVRDFLGTLDLRPQSKQ